MRQDRLIALALLLLAAAVYAQYGFDGELSWDSAIYLYGGQRLTAGVPPYRSIFDIKGPLGPMLVGLPVAAAQAFGWDDVYTARVAFFIIGCLTVSAIYLLARLLLESRRAGIYGALTFLGFLDFARFVPSGPDTKTPMVLLQTLSLLGAARRWWFSAALCGTLSALLWQPMVILPLVTLGIAVLQPRPERRAAVGRTLAGMALPLAATAAYFVYYGAFGDLLDGAVLFSVRYLDRGTAGFAGRAVAAAGGLLSGYRVMVLPILIGLMMIAYVSYTRLPRRGFLKMVRGDPFAPVILSLPPFVVLALLDFGGPSDWYVFLPYAAVGFAWFLDLALVRLEESAPPPREAGAARALGVGLAVGLIAVALVNIGAERESSLIRQRATAREIVRRYGQDVRMLSIGVPEALVLVRRVNPTPFVNLSSGIDRYIRATTPGGLEGWLRQLAEYNPDVVVFREQRRTHLEVREWLNAGFRRELIGPWVVYVR